MADDLGYHEITLENVMNGAAGVLFETELKKVIENLIDPNTDPKAARELSLVFKFRVSEDRRSAGISVSPKTKLAPHMGEVDMVHLINQGNELKAVALNAQQTPLFDEKNSEGERPSTPFILKKSV